MRSRFHWLSFALFALFLSVLPATAQDEAVSPLLDMLSRVPDSPLTRNELYFNDRHAIEAAYPPAQLPADFAEFDALQDADEELPILPQELWWRVFRNQASSGMVRYFFSYDTLPDVLGFDFFQIDHELNYGQPPQQTLHLEGRFELDAVRAALTNLGYVRSEGDMELWCSTDGCEEGSRQNLVNHNPTNPFGGDLGRKQPILITGDTILSSPSLEVIEAHEQVLSGDAPSLADAPEYRAAVAALTSEGTLLQAHFIDGELLSGLTEFSPTVFLNAPPEQIKQVLQDMLKDYETLPAFQLLALGDVATDSDQIGKALLVYDDADTAKIAAELIPRRIAAYQSIAVQRPLSEILEARGVTEVKAEVVKGGDTGKYVVVISLPTRKATIEEIAAQTLTNPDPPEVTAPGLVYRLLLDSVYRRDMGWLITTPREELEALVGE